MINLTERFVLVGQFCRPNILVSEMIMDKLMWSQKAVMFDQHNTVSQYGEAFISNNGRYTCIFPKKHQKDHWILKPSNVGELTLHLTCKNVENTESTVAERAPVETLCLSLSLSRDP